MKLGVGIGIGICLVSASCSSRPGVSTTSPQKLPPSPAAEPTDTPEPAVATAVNVATVRLSLDEPVELNGTVATLKAYIVEEIAAAPGHEDAYPAGSGVTMSIEVGGYQAELSELSAGYEGKNVAWTPSHKITLRSHAPRTSTVEVQIERISETAEFVVHDSFRLERGKEIALDSAVSAKFVGHGHKMVYEGQTSPLIVSMAYLAGEEEIDSSSWNLFPPEDNSWTWRNYRFDIESYEYDRFMILQVSRLALEPIEKK